LFHQNKGFYFKKKHPPFFKVLGKLAVLPTDFYAKALFGKQLLEKRVFYLK